MNEIEKQCGDREEFLPVIRPAESLPVPLPRLGPRHERAQAYFASWVNWASQQHINGMAHCPLTGSLWLATGGGILHWHSKQRHFTRYHSEHGLPGNKVAAIAIDGIGQPWCAPRYGGLYRLEDDHWINHTHKILGTEKIRLLVTDNDGKIWAGTRDGIYQFDHDGEVSKEIEFPAVEAPRAMAITEQGDLWLCSSQGLFMFDGSAILQVGKQPSLITLASAGTSLWVGKLDGLVHIDLVTKRAIQEAHWRKDAITALLPISDGVLVACDKSLVWVSNDAWDPILPIEDHVTSLISDGRDGSWIATHRGLLHWGKSAPLQYLETRAAPDYVPYIHAPASGGHLSNLIQCLTFQENILWVGTNRGLFRHIPGGNEFDVWNNLLLEVLQSVQALTLGQNGKDLWLSSWAGGVFRWQPSGSIERLPGLVVPVLALAVGVGGNQWALCADGLYQYHQENRWDIIFRNAQLPAGTDLHCVFQIDPGYLWLGASTGLVQYDLRNHRLITPKHHPFSRPVTALAYDHHNQILWAGTLEGLYGLRRSGDGWIAPEESHWTVQNSGLAANHINALAADTSDPTAPIIWIGTACGLCSFKY